MTHIIEFFRSLWHAWGAHLTAYQVLSCHSAWWATRGLAGYQCSCLRNLVLISTTEVELTLRLFQFLLSPILAGNRILSRWVTFIQFESHVGPVPLRFLIVALCSNRVYRWSWVLSIINPILVDQFSDVNVGHDVWSRISISFINFLTPIYIHVFLENAECFSLVWELWWLSFPLSDTRSVHILVFDKVLQRVVHNLIILKA